MVVEVEEGRAVADVLDGAVHAGEGIAADRNAGIRLCLRRAVHVDLVVLIAQTPIQQLADEIAARILADVFEHRRLSGLDGEYAVCVRGSRARYLSIDRVAVVDRVLRVRADEQFGSIFLQNLEAEVGIALERRIRGQLLADGDGVLFQQREVEVHPAHARTCAALHIVEVEAVGGVIDEGFVSIDLAIELVEHRGFLFWFQIAVRDDLPKRLCFICSFTHVARGWTQLIIPHLAFDEVDLAADMAMDAGEIQEQHVVDVHPHVVVAGEVEHHRLLSVFAGQAALGLHEGHLHLHAEEEVRGNVVVQAVQFGQRF